MDLRNNRFSDLPDLSSLSSSLNRLLHNNNNFTFEDIVPNIKVPSQIFTYSPQADVGETATYNLQQGDNFSIDLGIDPSISTSEYNWFKNNNLVTTTNINSLDLSPIQPQDAGVYRCEITNPNAPALTLYSKLVTVNVTICSPDTVTVTAVTCDPLLAGLIDTTFVDCERVLIQNYEYISNFDVKLGVTENCDSTQIFDLSYPLHSNAEYVWSTGGTEPSEYVYQSGEYWVMASAEGGCFDSDTITVSVSIGPTASFELVQNGNEVILTNTSVNAIAYLWDFGDGTTSSEENPTHVYATSGAYTVKLGAIAACGKDEKRVIVDVVTTSVFETSNFNIGLYPNPNDGNFNLSLYGLVNTDIDIRLIDLSGKIIFNQTEFIDKIQWLKSYELDLAQGIYEVVINSDNGSKSAKLVIF
ncbi:MAG: PKD domain-containing protein [Chitinophagales bacterium]